MYSPSSLMEALAVFPEIAAELVDVECGTYCAETEFDCFEGPALRLTLLGSEVALIALWSQLSSTAPEYPGPCHIYVVPELDGFQSPSHAWFTGAQRVSGRPFGVGPDFLILEHPEEWAGYVENLQAQDSPLLELSAHELAKREGLPQLVYDYMRELVAIHESKKPKFICQSCYDPTCPATEDRSAECINSDVL